MTFLCSQHRQHVLQQPSIAIDYWDQWMQQGSVMFNQQQWQQAISFLGCSFEIGEWLLTKPEVVIRSNLELDDDTELNHIDRYMLAGHHLGECLGRNGQSDMELHYLLTIHIKLLSILKSRDGQYWLLKNHLEISLAMLARYCEFHGQFKGYQDCYLETRLCINQNIN